MRKRAVNHVYQPTAIIQQRADGCRLIGEGDTCRLHHFRNLPDGIKLRMLSHATNFNIFWVLREFFTNLVAWTIYPAQAPKD